MVQWCVVIVKICGAAETAFSDVPAELPRSVKGGSRPSFVGSGETHLVGLDSRVEKDLHSESASRDERAKCGIMQSSDHIV